MSGRRITIEITVRARNDLMQILQWSKEVWGLDQQERYEREILACIERLGEFPEAGRTVVVGGVQYRRMLAGHHVVHYLTESSVVRIVRVLHERQQVTSDVLRTSDDD